MQLRGPVNVRFAIFVLVVGSVLAACGVGQSPADQPSTSPATVATPAKTGPTPSLPSPTVSPSPSLAAPSPDAAEVACSALLDNIPLVIVNSGKATVAASYEVTGAQLTSYFVKVLSADRNQTNGSDWWDQPTKLVDLCLYDGDFSTMTPGPPEADRSAVRVLVVISDGDAQFWASTRDESTIPGIDPATMSQ